MADISKFVDYEKTHPVALVNPATGEDLGIVFNVVSLNAPRVTHAARKYERDTTAAKAAGSVVDDLDFSDGISRARLAASIDSWNWGGHEFGDLGPEPDCTAEARAYVINHPNADWIRGQVALGMARIENFTQELQKPAKTTSRKK